MIDSKNLPSLDKPLKKFKIDSTVSPSPSPKPTPSRFPTPTPTPSPSPTPTVRPTPSPVPAFTLAPKSVITSVTPAKLQKPKSGNAEFAINGQYLTGSKAVFLNQFELQFFVVDGYTIFATVSPNVGQGIYDVFVTAANGEKLTLYRALEVQ